MTRQELYRRARLAVEQRRQAAHAQSAARRKRAYEALPQLAELDAAIAAAGVAAAGMAAEGKQQAAAQKLEEKRGLQARREQLLKQGGFGSLRPAAGCTACGDTGWVNGQTCACVHNEARRLRREEINAGSRMAPCRFDNFQLERYPERMEDENGNPLRPRAAMEGILRDCMDWAAEFGPRSQSLYLFGFAGLGKTHLALSMAHQVLEAGHDVIYVGAQRAFTTIAEGEDDGVMYRSMLEAELLVLDDLGTEFLNAFTRAKLYDLVDSRMGRRPTIYTSNICSQEMLNLRYDEKIASRLLGDCHLMRFWGQDIRLQKG